MKQAVRDELLAGLTLMGAIVGVGIFGIPFVLARAGVLLGLGYFALLGAVILIVHLFYAEVAIAAKERLRIVGLTRKFLGERWRHLALAAEIFGLYGGQVAYIIIGGEFLRTVLAPMLGGTDLFYQTAFFIALATATAVRLRLVASIEATLTGGLVLALLALLAFGIPEVRVENLITINWKDAILPYGVILFSIAGTAVIPELEDIFHGSVFRYRRAVVWGTLIPVVLTALFGTVIVGVSGAATTEQALAGLEPILGRGFVLLGVVFGLLAVATSFLIFAVNLKATFQYDYKMRPLASWALATIPPYVVFLLGARNFIRVIGFSGSVFGGIMGILVVALFLRVRAARLVKHPLPVHPAIARVVAFVLILGIVAEAVLLFR